MTGIRICFINPDGSKVCLRLQGGGIQPPPVHPVPGGTQTGGSSGEPGSGGSSKPGGGSGKPIVREDLLTDLSLIDSVYSASSKISDTDARSAMLEAVETVLKKMQGKVHGSGFTIEVDK